MALVDYKFISISAGDYGNDSDFCKSFSEERWQPVRYIFSMTNLCQVVLYLYYTLKLDMKASLQKHLMRSYPRKQIKSSLTNQVYIYCHSKARGIVPFLPKFSTVSNFPRASGYCGCRDKFLRNDTSYWTSEEEKITIPRIPRVWEILIELEEILPLLLSELDNNVESNKYNLSIGKVQDFSLIIASY